MSTDLKEVVEKKIKKALSVPSNWKVIFLNDDHTPMSFVVAILVELFRHTTEQAEQLMSEIHTSGSAVVGIYTYEIAEIKSIESTSAARANGYPLQVKIEEV
jgi:ATP-dependent Clp protease adaptor protein ClpS